MGDCLGIPAPSKSSSEPTGRYLVSANGVVDSTPPILECQMNEHQEEHRAEKHKRARPTIPEKYTLGGSSEDPVETGSDSPKKRRRSGLLVVHLSLIGLGVILLVGELRKDTPGFVMLLLSIAVLVCGIVGLVQEQIRKND